SPPAVVGRVRLAQQVLLDLARGGLGQFVDDDDRLGHLVGVEARSDAAQELVLVEVYAGLGDHYRGDSFGPPFVRQADDGDFGDIVVGGVEGLLNLDGSHV